MFLIADDRRYLLDDAGVIEDAEEDQISRCGTEEKDGPPGIVEKGVGQFPAYQCNKSHYDRAPFRLRAIAPAAISRNVFMPYRRRRAKMAVPRAKAPAPMSSSCRDWETSAGA